MKKLILLLIVRSLLEGHEVATHQKIGDAALAYLAVAYPNRPWLAGSLNALQPLLEYGAAHEDDGFFTNQIFGVDNPYGRFIFHFTPALQDSLTLSTQDAEVSISVSANGCSSVNWGQSSSQVNAPNGQAGCTVSCFSLSPPLFVACLVISSISNMNNLRWDQDLDADPATGAPTTQASRQFGYVIHLLEDLGSPPHTRNDAHPCPAQGFTYCDEFEEFNGYSKYAPYGDPRHIPQANDPAKISGTVWQQFLSWTAPAVGPIAQVIPTDNFTTVTQFFDALQLYTSSNYYSNRTAFAPNITGIVGPAQGPESLFSDSNYFYGACLVVSGIPISQIAATCVSVTNPGDGQTYMVRKIAHKGNMYWQSCGFLAKLGLLTENTPPCDPTKADIDQTIAREQFAELGPVIAQHVAAFIMFYAPALTVHIEGTGIVTSSPGNGINCTSGAINGCSALFVQGASVTLTVPTGSSVTWGGACDSAGTVTLTSDMACTATFTSDVTLMVQVLGSGSVTSSVGGLNCGNSGIICSAKIIAGTVVSLAASANAGVTFVGWGGSCSSLGMLNSTNPVTLTVTANTTCTATFGLTYTYIGQPFNSFYNYCSDQLQCGTVGANLIMSFTFTGPLPANGTWNPSVIPMLWWTVSDGVTTFSGDECPYANANEYVGDCFDEVPASPFIVQFSFSTTNGLISSWYVQVNDDCACTFSNTFISKSQGTSGDSSSIWYDGFLPQNPYLEGGYVVGASSSLQGTWSGGPSLLITTTTLRSAQSANPYRSMPLSATGGTPPYTWTASGLPAGFSISGGSLSSSGRPLAVGGSYQVALTVTDASGLTASATLPLVVALTIR